MNRSADPSPASSALGVRVRQARLALNLTLDELARRAGCTKGYLSGIENHRRGVPTDEMLERIERALELPSGELVRAAGWERVPTSLRREWARLAAREATQREREKRLASLLARSGMGPDGRLRGALDEAYRSGELQRLVGTEGAAEGVRGLGALERALPREVPLINRVQAGYPREFTDLGYPARVADEYVRCPDIDDPDAFAARVVGDSMLPDYREGDIVVFSPAREVRSGMDCFARLEPDGETTFKRVFFEHAASDGERSSFENDPSGGLVRLQPLNPAYAPRVVARESVGGLYAAVSVIKRVA